MLLWVPILIYNIWKKVYTLKNKSDDLLLDLDETHAQVIRDANSTEPDSSLDELETKLEKMSGAICEMEAAEMANACQFIGLEIFSQI